MFTSRIGGSEKLNCDAENTDDHGQQWTSDMGEEVNAHCSADSEDQSTCGRTADQSGSQDDDRADVLQGQGSDDKPNQGSQEKLDIAGKWEYGGCGDKREAEAQNKDARHINPISQHSNQDAADNDTENGRKPCQIKKMEGHDAS